MYAPSNIGLTAQEDGSGAYIDHPSAGAFFGALAPQPPDALLSLIALHRADPRPYKLDLGVGVYRDEHGRTPVMHAVKTAEQRLAETQVSKSYLGAEGDVEFVRLLADCVFGSGNIPDDALRGVQTPGGTGALRLGAELIARANPSARVWVGTPTWPNHIPIFLEAGLRVETHDFIDVVTGQASVDRMFECLASSQAGDVVLLHGCCHNPTGVEFSLEQWIALADFFRQRRLLPFIDFAYQGLGSGWDSDAAGLRAVIARLPSVLVAYSCDKNFGLYRDRVGALWMQTEAKGMAAAWSNLLVLARSLWSMPPDHGAALVRMILENEVLVRNWLGELETMRTRLVRLRRRLAEAHPMLASLGGRTGMFAILPLSTSSIAALREENGIYMADSGRVNLAGLTDETMDEFLDALVGHL